jgi:cytochrome P450
MKETNQDAGKPIPTVPATQWFLKNLGLFGKDPLGFFIKHQALYGDIFDVNVPRTQFILLSKPAYIKHVLVDNNRNYTKAFAYQFLKKALGNGLLTSEGDFWLKQRRIAQPAFHRERLLYLVERMVDLTSQLLQHWQVLKSQQQTFDLAAEMMKLTSAIAAQSLLSSDVSKLVGSIVRDVAILNESTIKKIATPFIFRAPLWVPTPLNVRFTLTRRRLNTIIFQIINSRRVAQVRHDDLLQMLMETRDEETGETMSDQQLRDEILTLFIAGSETSSNALTWALYLLWQHPEIREKVAREVQVVLSDRLPTVADLPALKYTQQVIQETMRLYPPAWLLGRQAIANDTIDGYHIPKGAQIYISTYVLHRHPDLWNSPDTFDPDRFTPENIKNRHKFAYIPFGSGPRFCIGNNFAIMEMTVALAMIVREFRLRPVSPAPIVMEPLITLRPKSGLRMQFE